MTIGGVEDVDSEQLEQLAASVAMSPALTDTDRQAVIEVLRAPAEVDRTALRHPSPRR